MRTTSPSGRRPSRFLTVQAGEDQIPVHRPVQIVGMDKNIRLSGGVGHDKAEPLGVPLQRAPHQVEPFGHPVPLRPGVHDLPFGLHFREQPLKLLPLLIFLDPEGFQQLLKGHRFVCLFLHKPKNILFLGHPTSPL